MKQICLFGDSISKGVIIDKVLNRYTMTKQSFANLVTSEEPWFSLVNHSMLGCTISKGRGLIARYCRDIDSCDVVVLEYGGNDSDHNWAEIADNPETEHLPKTPLNDFANNYRELVAGLRARNKKMVMLNLPPIDEHKYFNWFSNGLNKDNILKWLGGSDEYIFKFHESYNAQVCGIAEENDIPLIDIRSAFLKLPNYSEYLCDDGIHPNEKGHNLIARVITEYIPRIMPHMTNDPMLLASVCG